jgi:hypothetical protein
VAPLSYLYASFVQQGVSDQFFVPSNSLELAIIATQIVRIAALMAVGRLRRMGLLRTIDALSVEVLLIPILVAVSVASGDSSYLGLVNQVALAWPAAFALVFPIYALYRLASAARDSGAISTVVSSSVGLLALLSFLFTTVSAASGAGLATLTRLLVATFLHLTNLIRVSPVIEEVGVSLYVLLLVYSALEGKWAPTRRDLTLVFPVVATIVSIAWTSIFGPPLQGDALFVFGIPAVVIVTLLWVSTRAG